MASLEGDNLVVFYYLSVSEIWPDKRDGPRLSSSREAIPLIRPVFRYTEIVKYH
jgi:hypothetical protein